MWCAFATWMFFPEITVAPDYILYTCLFFESYMCAEVQLLRSYVNHIVGKGGEALCWHVRNLNEFPQCRSVSELKQKSPKTFRRKLEFPDRDVFLVKKTKDFWREKYKQFYWAIVEVISTSTKILAGLMQISTNFTQKHYHRKISVDSDELGNHRSFCKKLPWIFLEWCRTASGKAEWSSIKSKK